MNKEILEIAKHLKNKINSGEGVDEYNWQDIIDVCNELERINNLEPVGWMYPVFHDDKMQFTTDAVTSENIDIHFQSHGSPFKVTPLYRLD
ncbi:hypothetical protein AB7281_14525 [Providencia rettgeri]